ncbi:MAG: glycosyltransferase family 87 protein [Vulcanimicrobiaceae bacterium]
MSTAPQSIPGPVPAAPAIGMPLRLSAGRSLLYGCILMLVASAPALLVPSWFRAVARIGDFATFWSGGATVGTPALADPRLHSAWQHLHGFAIQPFLYLPAFAYLYVPYAALADRSPLRAGLLVEELSMAALFALAGFLVARIYGFKPWFGLLAVFAWGPTLNAIEVGQNTAIALVLMLVATVGLIRRKQVLLGLAVGLLLYKPTDALPFIMLLAVRRQWRALAVVAAAAGGWYALSVAATAGDVFWPIRYMQTIGAWSAPDFAGSAHKAFTLPTVLLALGFANWLAVGAGALVLIAGLALLARVGALEAASFVGLVGLAASTHAWPYDAALLIPSIAYAMTRVSEPWRTRVIVATYLIGSFGLLAQRFDPLAIVCIGGAAWWIGSGCRNEFVVSRGR